MQTIALVDDDRNILTSVSIALEAEALRAAEQRLDETFERAVELIAKSTGRVIVSGIGKSGIIGRKIAATLTSTGTPATFLHR